MNVVHRLVKVMYILMIQYETIDAAQIKEIMAGKKPTPPEGWVALEKQAAQE